MPDLREYELLYILKPTIADDQIPAAIDKVAGMVTTRGGDIYEVLQTPPWGKRKLAYPIDRHVDGFYVVNHMRMDPDTTADFERMLEINEDVIRHMLVRMDV
ncbi:MAG TPA: 30S ribosomal protein S6 [Chloroflexia bacterium]|jgi:small subunit ribosomal protein S6|nr:30S ribosomal protein S6 [Chloroflexia bacterium]